MSSARKILAAVAVTGVIAILPISTLSSSMNSAGPVVGGTVSTGLNGGQGNWPLKR